MILNFLSPKVLTADLCSLPNKKLLINTINAHSYNVAKKDPYFLESLYNSNFILPDGIGVVIGYKLLKRRVKKVAGADLFYYQMRRLNEQKGTCFSF